MSSFTLAILIGHRYSPVGEFCDLNSGNLRAFRLSHHAHETNEKKKDPKGSFSFYAPAAGIEPATNRLRILHYY